ncbi:MAG: outer membrane protein OmpA-like peptidoglycan-associated protein [Candidatus Deianiraeaceae bacterium]|jgi:outer membrane protein OmpA-like peptidoglycan-associated protein
MKGGEIIKLCVFLSIASCIGTKGSDFYSDQAYKSMGVYGGQDNPTNVVPIVPGDQHRQKRIADNQKHHDDFISRDVNQQMPFALKNTQNHSRQVSDSRKINTVNIHNDYYAEYLRTLASEYGKYSTLFAKKGMQSDAQLLEAKSQTASSGHDVVFETEYSFNLPADKQSIIVQQRKTLENIKARIDILKEHPQTIARIQSAYDCTVLEAKSRMYSRNTPCGLAYFHSLEDLEQSYGKLNTAHGNQGYTRTRTENTSYSGQGSGMVNSHGSGNNMVNNQRSDGQSTSERESHFVEHSFEYEDRATLKYDNHKSFVVYYDIGSDTLDSTAVYAINRAIAFAQEYDDYHINVLGFTDRIASRDYNKSLSDKRAARVQRALIERGIPLGKINKLVFGEDYNSINTRDGVGESFNRRVVIEVDVSAEFDEDTFIIQQASESSIAK